MTAKSPNSIPGIYKIINKISGRTYVGGTNNCNKRWTKHIWLLRLGLHKIKDLQEDWNNLGEKNFEFMIYLRLPKLPIVQFKILKTEKETEVLNSIQNCYNLTIGAGDSGFKLSDKTKKELSKINKARWSNPEYKKRLSEIHKKKWELGEYNKNIKKETREKQSIAKKLYYDKHGGMPEEHRKNLSISKQQKKLAKLAAETGNDPVS